VIKQGPLKADERLNAISSRETFSAVEMSVKTVDSITALLTVRLRSVHSLLGSHRTTRFTGFGPFACSRSRGETIGTSEPSVV